jgi:hypothetical protein
MFSLLSQPDKNFAMKFLQPARNGSITVVIASLEMPFLTINGQRGITTKHASTSQAPPWQSLAGFAAFTFGAAP